MDRLNGYTGEVAIKSPCRVASIANITALAGLLTIDGIALAAGDRVLVKDQSVPSLNGIYAADTGAWFRTKDFNGPGDIVQGTAVYANAGSTQAGATYRVDTVNPQIGAAITFSRSANSGGSGGGSSGTVGIDGGGTGATTKTNAFDNLAPTNAKGDLIVHNGDDNVRMQVGADGKVLTADSSSPTGYSFSDAGSGDVVAANNLSELTDKAKAFNTIAPTTTEGDITVRTATGNVRLPIGADGTVLSVNLAVGGKIEWRAPAAVVGALLAANNLSDLVSTTAARSNLGLGTLAIQPANNANITGGSITGMPTPTGASDVATKGYVDAVFGGTPPVAGVAPAAAYKYVFNASNKTGTVDITSELKSAIEQADAAGEALFIPAGTYYASNLDPNSGFDIVAEPGTVNFINDRSSAFFRTASQKAYLAAATTSLSVTAVAMGLYLDPLTADNDFVSVLTVSTNPVAAGIKPGDTLHIHSQNDHPYAYVALGTNPMTTTAGNSTVTVTHPAHGFQTGQLVRFWDTGGAIADINGIPAAQIFSKAGNIVDLAITRVNASSYTFTVAAAAATGSAAGGTTIRAVGNKAFYGEDFQVLGVTENQVFVSGRLRQHEFYTDGIKINTFAARRRARISGVTFRGKRTSGEVTHARVSTAGSGFTSAPNVVFSAPAGGGTTATGVATIVNGALGDIRIVNHGTGYSTAETVTITITGGGGSGAAALATVDGDPFDADYDSPAVHAHTLGIWYMPGAIVENCRFENLWEGGLELRHSPFSVMRNCSARKLPNYKTSAAGFVGRFGYFAYAFGSGYSAFSGLTAEQCRHDYTDDNATHASYSAANWMEMGQPVNNLLVNLSSANSIGVPVAPREGSNGLIASGITIRNAFQGATAGLERGCGILLRGSNTTIDGYQQDGGSDGIRVQATEQVNSTHIVRNASFRNLTDASAEGSYAIRIPALTGTIYRSTLQLDGNISVKNCGYALRLDAGAVVSSAGLLRVTSIRRAAIMVNDGAAFDVSSLSADFTDATDTTQSRQVVSMQGASSAVIRDLDLTLGAAKNPSVVFASNDTIAGKTVGIARNMVKNTFSGVNAPDLLTAGRYNLYTWLGVASSNVRRQTRTVNASNTLLMSDDGKTIIVNSANPVTLTVPATAPGGFRGKIVQRGAGAVTLAVESGGSIGPSAVLATSGERTQLFYEVTENGTGSSAYVVVSASASSASSGGSSGGSTPSSVLTTKGDMLVRSASGDARLPVGTNGYTIVADSDQVNGVRWGRYSVGNLLEVAQTTINRSDSVSSKTNQYAFTMGVADSYHFNQQSTVGNPSAHTVQVTRKADYSGKGVGVCGAVYAMTFIGADADSNEWAVLGSVRSSGGSGENVGVYGQGWRGANLAGQNNTTWGMCGEARDTSGAASVHQSGYGTLLWGAEFDCFASGADPALSRTGVFIVAGNSTVGLYNDDGSPKTSPAGVIYSGMTIEVFGNGVGTFTSDGTACASYTMGVAIGDRRRRTLFNNGGAMTCQVAIGIYTVGQIGIQDEGTKIVGFWANAAYSAAAFRMNAGAKFSLNETDSVTMFWNGADIAFSRGINIQSITNGTAIRIDASGAAGQSLIYAPGWQGRVLDSRYFTIDNNGYMVWSNGQLSSISSSAVSTLGLRCMVNGTVYALKLFPV